MLNVSLGSSVAIKLTNCLRVTPNVPVSLRSQYGTLCLSHLNRALYPYEEILIERKIYRALFNPEKQHNWRCPTCEQGLLRIKKDTFSFFETAESLRDRRNPEWQAEWVEYVYSCIFECQNDQCGEPVSSSGIGFLDWDIVENEYGEDKQEYSPHFKAKSFYPPLKIIKIPEGTPEDVSGSLEQSFELYFTNAGACANQVRSAVEALLTAVKVKRFKIGKSKRELD